MSDTPETDEIRDAYESQRESVGGIIEHAEALEKERDEARRIAENLNEGNAPFYWQNKENRKPKKI